MQKPKKSKKFAANLHQPRVGWWVPLRGRTLSSHSNQGAHPDAVYFNQLPGAYKLGGNMETARLEPHTSGVPGFCKATRPMYQVLTCLVSFKTR